MSRRPLNLLVLWSDQHRADVMPGNGNSALQAPHLGRLASQGCNFRRAYCTQPVCTPSRASVLTGLWPHTHGCVTNNIPLRTDVRTIAELVPQEYRKAYFGKWHLGDELSAQHGFDDWVSIEDGIYRQFYTRPADLARRSDYHHFLVENGFPPDTVDEDGNELFSRPFAAAMAEPFTKASFLAGRAARFLSEQTEDRPFLLSVNFLEPHPPTFGPLNRIHDPNALQVGPATGVPPAAGASRHARRVAEQIRGNGYKRHPVGSEPAWRRLRANYYGLVSLVDRAIGRILEALEASGQADNTIVVYTSDHGDMMGDHALMQKGVFYEESSRIPLLIHVPGVPAPRVFDQPVSHIDLVPTLLELLECDAPPQLAGTSRAGIIRNPNGFRAAPVVVEWNDPEHPEEEGRSIVTVDGWKLNLYRDDDPELYDLERDPAELKNLAGHAAHGDRVNRLHDLVRDWQQTTGDALRLRD